MYFAGIVLWTENWQNIVHRVAVGTTEATYFHENHMTLEGITTGLECMGEYCKDRIRTEVVGSYKGGALPV